MRAACKSDIGQVRGNNEDSLLADVDNDIFLLADGMGGHAGGEVASELAVRTAHDYLGSRIGATGSHDLPRLLASALAAAHSAVSKRGLLEERLAGMGTTLEIMVVRDAQAVICHVGDSRVYLFRHDTLTQLTGDDNAAAWLKDYEGVKDELVLRAARHILTQAVGVSDELVPEVRTIDLLQEDLFLLCSDGLTEMLSDREIAALMRHGYGNLDTLAAALVDEANAAGGYDNVSVLLVVPEAVPPAPKLLR